MKIARKRKAAGILPEDFQTRPALSRQLFAIRLMNTIFPPQTTRNLPGRYKAMFAPTPRDIDVVNEYSFSSMPAGFNWAQLPPSVLRFIAWTLAQGQFDAGEIDRAMLDNLYALIYEIPPPPPPPPPGVPHWYVPPDPEWRTIVPPLPAPTPGGPVPPWGFGPENPPTIRTPSPIGGKWYNYTDDTCWREADFFFTWTGTAWHMEQGMGDGEIRVATGATWYLDFRPTAIRLTYTGPTSSFALYSQYNATILTPTQIPSGGTAALDFTMEQNIKSLYGIDSYPAEDIFITKIEFFG